jgi:carbamoyltransferase
MADDTGNSIGQAMHFYNTIAQSTDVNSQTNLFFHGVEDTTDIDGETCTEKDIAKLLKKQKIVAVYNGLAEAGQRALGNRSILFDARNENAKEIVNKVKNREWYRPFAAAVLKEDFADYFDTYGLTESPFMTISFPVTSKEIPGVTHVDNTCRVQTVDIGVPHLYNLLREFKKQTDCSVLLNTSFNVAGQPLIETVAEAIETFNNSDIDVLWFPKLKKMIRK